MTGSIIELDPKKVTLGTNIRTIKDLDPDFIASIKDVGVLQPPTIVQTATGYEVIIGHRRTLGAVKAGLKLVPFYLVPQHEAETAKILDQITENEQREKLTKAEIAGGFQQLTLLGWTADDIAERTRRPKKLVDAAIAVAGSESVTATVVEHDIDLEQAAELVAFQGNKKATDALVSAARYQPNSFTRVLREQQQAVKLAASKKELAAQLVADGTPKAKSGDYPSWAYGNNAKTGSRLSNLVGANGKDLTAAAHKKCPGHAGFVEAPAYEDKASIVYVCTDWAANGHAKRGGGAAPLSADEVAKRAEEAEARAQRDRDTEIARDLRVEFIQGLIQRNKPATLPGASTLIAIAVNGDITDVRYYDRNAGKTLTLKMLQAPESEKDAAVQLEEIALETKDPMTVALAGALGLYEASVRKSLDGNHKIYFDTIVSWGHNLTDSEKTALAGWEKRQAELLAEETADESDFDEEFDAEDEA